LIHNFSYPKSRVRWLLLESISPTARAILTKNGYTNIEVLPGALDEDELVEKVQGVHILGIRSRTQVTKQVLNAAKTLMAIGCFSVGTSQIDLRVASQRGIPVFNAPFSNTRSVAELTIAEIVMLMRGVFPKSTAAHQGIWMKTAVGSHEIRGKTLGIVGYGNIGMQLSNLAEAMGMRVIYFDPVNKLQQGNVVPTESLDALLAESDIVSLHVSDRPETWNMFRAEQIAQMKKGAFLINNARGKVVDIDALAEALRSGQLGGAAIDVFPVEPKSDEDEFVSPLRGLDNVILTPHVGGSTEEAQHRIGEEVTKRLVEYSEVGSTTGAVSFPQVQLPNANNATRFTQVHHNTPGAMRSLNDLFSRRGLNIFGQYMQAYRDIGYVVLDVDSPIEDPLKIQEEIRSLPNTIRSRLLKLSGAR
jgi:D-3-phosphoglycerate dehydrogenase